jgi:hypothetical protein
MDDFIFFLKGLGVVKDFLTHLQLMMH